MSNTIRHKRGAGLRLVLVIPEAFDDGHFIGWTLSAHLRTRQDVLVEILGCDWVDRYTTRVIVISSPDTSAWPLGMLSFDVRLTGAGSPTLNTTTVTIFCEKETTHA